MTFVCPPSHKHAVTKTCYSSHGCRCDECREGNTEYRRANRGYHGRDLRPCGTAAAARRHRRNGEPVDQACLDAETRDKRRRVVAIRERDRAAHATSVTAELVDGRVVIVAPVEDARVIAAAVLDRALSLEVSRYAATSAVPGVEQAAAIDALRAMHKRIVSVTRCISRVGGRVRRSGGSR